MKLFVYFDLSRESLVTLSTALAYSQFPSTSIERLSSLPPGISDLNLLLVPVFFVLFNILALILRAED